jgi:hypothetical protein
MVVRLSGNKDPMNDDDAVLEIGYSPDKIVKDARNAVAIDYSYRILKSAQYNRMDPQGKLDERDAPVAGQEADAPG